MNIKAYKLASIKSGLGYLLNSPFAGIICISNLLLLYNNNFVFFMFVAV